MTEGMLRDDEARQAARLRIALLLLLLGLAVVMVVMTHNVLTSRFPGHNDFMTPWEATRAFWHDGLNPYGPAATERIQDLIFGRPPLPEEDPGFFSYPLYGTYVVLPFSYSEYAWASAAWMVFLEACLIGALLLSLSLYHWWPRPWVLLGLALWTLAFYPGARGLILGQIGHVVYLLQVFALWAIWRGQDRYAGIALGISTLKPQMGYLLVPLLLLWAWRSGRWRFIRAFISTFAVLMASAFLVYPGWFGEWLHRLSVYPSYTLGSPVWIITQHYLSLGDLGEWTLTLALYVLVFSAWWPVLVARQTDRLLWVVMWTLTLTHIVAPRTASPHFILFVPLLVFYLRGFGQAGRSWLSLVLLLLLLVLPWVHFLTTVGGVNGEQEDPSVHLALPILFLVLLWLTRRAWWQDGPQPLEVNLDEKETA